MGNRRLGRNSCGFWAERIANKFEAFALIIFQNSIIFHMRLVYILLCTLLVCMNGCNHQTTFLSKMPIDEGRVETFAYSPQNIMTASRQILRLHDFNIKKEEKLNNEAYCLIAEQISIEILQKLPLTDGNIRVIATALSPDSTIVRVVWLSGLRKNLKARIENEVTDNTNLFFKELAMRLNQ